MLGVAIAWTGIAAAGALAVYWLVVAIRVEAELGKSPSLRDGLSLAPPAKGWPKVSVIVPAHNEEAHAPGCARSILANDHPDFELIFVLDRCTDGTKAALEPIARADPRLRILENDSCPEDWAGKCNAARVGAAHAGGDMLLFTDADTQFDPALIRAAVALSLSGGLGLLSAMSTLSTEESFERLAQPVAALALMQMFPLSRVNDPERPRGFANGQFMLFSREAYEAIGGHARVKDDLLEDIAFGRVVARERRGLGLFVADGMLSVSMYDSLAAFEEGWKRIYIEACRRSVWRLRRKAIETWGVGVLLPLLAWAGLIGSLVAAPRGLMLAAAGTVAAASGLQWLSLARVYGRMRHPIMGALAFPWGSWIVGRAMWHGAADLAARRPVRWGGRAYTLEPR